MHTGERLNVFNEFACAIASIAINTNLAEEIGAVLSESQNAVKDARKRDAARFQAELADLERREDQLYDDRVRGLLDDDGYRRQLARLRTQRAMRPRRWRPPMPSWTNGFSRRSAL